MDNKSTVCYIVNIVIVTVTDKGYGQNGGGKGQWLKWLTTKLDLVYRDYLQIYCMPLGKMRRLPDFPTCHETWRSVETAGGYHASLLEEPFLVKHIYNISLLRWRMAINNAALSHVKCCTAAVDVKFYLQLKVTTPLRACYRSKDLMVWHRHGWNMQALANAFMNAFQQVTTN